MAVVVRQSFRSLRLSMTNMRCSRQIHSNKKNYKIRLHKIGTVQEPNISGEPYPPGTLFLHKIFPYRGIVVHSWKTDVHETKVPSKLLKNLLYKDANKETNVSTDDDSETTRTRQQFYYLVLPDKRDIPYINIETEFFLGDYVLHEDMIPFAGSELSKPVQHHLFSKLFTLDPSNELHYVLQDNVDPMNAALLPKDVYRETTEQVRVTVTPLQLKLEYQRLPKQHMWQYYIRLENLGSSTVTLRERVWKIVDKENVLVTVKGKGVVGKEPVLSSQFPAFQYSSFVTLESSSGWMWGVFVMERENGSKFECKIPKFQLKGTHKEESQSSNDK